MACIGPACCFGYGSAKKGTGGLGEGRYGAWGNSLKVAHVLTNDNDAYHYLRHDSNRGKAFREGIWDSPYFKGWSFHQ